MVVLGAADGVALTHGLCLGSKMKARQLVTLWTEMSKDILGLPKSHPEFSAKASARQYLHVFSLSIWDSNNLLAEFEKHCNLWDEDAAQNPGQAGRISESLIDAFGCGCVSLLLSTALTPKGQVLYSSSWQIIHA